MWVVGGEIIEENFVWYVQSNTANRIRGEKSRKGKERKS